MKKTILIAIAASALTLSGCATKTPGPNVQPVDEKYVGVVNHYARQTGNQVIWVNPPKRKSADIRYELVIDDQ
ncbi:MAG: hypothetical protein R3323_06620 [Wenzhouxiangellaceae bacterium]|nr:hypothetical protein [Wenzhouxiangellaceae bacterium]